MWCLISVCFTKVDGNIFEASVCYIFPSHHARSSPLKRRRKIYAGNKNPELVKSGLQILCVCSQKWQFFLNSAHFQMVTKGPTAPFELSPFPLGTEEVGQRHPPCSCLKSVWWVHLVRGTEQSLLASAPCTPLRWVTRAPEPASGITTPKCLSQNAFVWISMG